MWFWRVWDLEFWVVFGTCVGGCVLRCVWIGCLWVFVLCGVVFVGFGWVMLDCVVFGF